MQKFIRQNTNNPNATYYPKGELVITKDLLKGGNNLRLAWKLTISSLVPNNEQLIYVDAVTGEVIRETPLIYDVNTPCTAQTRYSGTVGITGDSFAGVFRLRENRNNVSVQTLNLQGTFNYANAVDFANANTNFTNGNWPNFNQDQVALDAHLGAESVLDYWRVIHNRNSIDGNGIQVTGYVHYFQANSSAGWPNNAQWDGTNHVMRYGDGDGISFNPFTALDICAHEMGHGITQFTANLTPGTQESGALNEGFSDIWGACVENRSAPTKQTWLFGEEIFRGGVFTCIRNLQNPKSTTTAEGQHPDTYHGNFWDNNGEPHNNSTVLSHWFFLISQGGNGTNDIGSVYNIAGLGINIARLIAYRTESVYLTSSANYAAARTASIQSARDLYGTGSCQEIAVTNGWFAVGVGTAYTGNAGLSISGDNIFCTTSTNYTIPNLPAGATVTWSVSPLGIANPNTPNLTQTTLSKNGSGIITLTATVSNACGGTPITVTKQNISVGVPAAPTSILAVTSIHDIDMLVDGGTIPPNVSSYNWYSNNVMVPNQHTSECDILVTCNVNYSIAVQAVNACGASLKYSKLEKAPCGLNDYTISPNPASGMVTVSTVAASHLQSKTESTTVSQKKIYQIKVLDQAGNILKTFIYSAGISSPQINLNSLFNGTYILQIYDNVTWSTQQVVIIK